MSEFHRKYNIDNYQISNKPIILLNIFGGK